MSAVDHLVARAQAYCQRTGAAPTTVSRKLLGNGNRLAELESGKSLRVDTLETAHRLLDEMEKAA